MYLGGSVDPPAEEEQNFGCLINKKKSYTAAATAATLTECSRSDPFGGRRPVGGGKVGKAVSVKRRVASEIFYIFVCVVLL